MMCISLLLLIVFSVDKMMIFWLVLMLLRTNHIVFMRLLWKG